MIIEISIAVIALAFVVLVIYLISAIKALRITLGQVNQTLAETRHQLGDLGGQTQKILEHTNQISFDLKQKVEAINPIFNAIGDAGEVFEHRAAQLKSELKASSELKEDEKLKAIEAIFELGGAGIKLWQKLRKRR